MTLALAVLHKEAWLKARAGAAHDPRFRWYHGAYPRFDDKLEASTWHELEMVSLASDGTLLGWMAASFARAESEVNSLAFARYSPQMSMEYARDMARFLRLLFVYYGQHAVRWFVIIGSPHEGAYDRLVQLLGGRVWGRDTQGAVLPDGTRHDRKFYEVLAANLNRHALDRMAGEERHASKAHGGAQGRGQVQEPQGHAGRRVRGSQGAGRGQGSPARRGGVLRQQQRRADGPVESRGVGA